MGDSVDTISPAMYIELLLFINFLIDKPREGCGMTDSFAKVAVSCLTL
jgi:hypothetical protein